MKQYYAKYLLEKTKDDYNRMSRKFSSTRNFLSSDILALKKYSVGAKDVLDLGCGNGRLFELFEKDKNKKYTGADISRSLIEIARKRYPKGKFSLLRDPIKLPYIDARFDIVYSLSVFHHIPSTDFRSAYLKEIFRVLKPDGKLVLTVWNLSKTRSIRNRLFINGLLSFFHLIPIDKGDLFYEFKEGDKLIAKRYLHCFTDVEMKELLNSAGFLVEEKEISRRGKSKRFSNILFVCRKID